MSNTPEQNRCKAKNPAREEHHDTSIRPFLPPPVDKEALGSVFRPPLRPASKPQAIPRLLEGPQDIPAALLDSALPLLKRLHILGRRIAVRARQVLPK